MENRARMTDEKPSAIDLFCGCGGLSLGFEQAGFDIIAAYDNWRPAIETYAENFHHPAHLAELSGDFKVPASTVVIGGPPCQGFSSAGMRSPSDARNTLVRVFSTIVARVRPLAFVFENVEGFLTGAHGGFLFDLLEPLISVGYRIHLRKVNAAHYGVPQHRKRIIAVGGLGWNPPFPTPTHSAFGAPGATLGNGHGLPVTPTVGAALTGLPPAIVRQDANGNDVLDHKYSPFSAADTERAKMLKPGQSMRDLPEHLWHKSYRRRAYRRVLDGTPTERRGGAPAALRRLRADEPSKAITGGALRDFVHPTEDRPLTVRECARLQTFPDGFRFKCMQAEKIQLIGNAVPVQLARAIAETLRQGLDKCEQVYSEGCLLTFVPTLSQGRSPALMNVIQEVCRRFPVDSPVKQEQLWA